MVDFVEREKIQEVISDIYKDGDNAVEDSCIEIWSRVKEIPAADVRPVVRGHWTNHRTLFTNCDWYCSACGKAITIYMGPDREDRYAYCPNCGADMREENEDEKNKT